MLRRLSGFIVTLACGWVVLSCCVATQAVQAGHSKDTLTFALYPLGRPTHVPIDIEGIVLDGKFLSFDEPLSLPADWPAHMSVRLRNISSQPITYVMLSFSFPESGVAGRSPYGYQVHLGNLIPAQAHNQRGEPVTRKQIEPLVWAPNTEVTIPLSSISDTLASAEQLHSPISRIEVQAPSVQFQNTSLWNGNYFRCQQDGIHCTAASFSEFLPQ